ncbi:hypothetical protein NPIL_36631 [Nephila pilipes]|uniref:Uncharacterized protein n=1 Tax=Nephila pilipes TaxID=299642 RepID=A0A8X6N5Z5_NEPPI|nr:hypothetical protein NPIL_36631 [Nephila pilipes]
MSSDGFQQSSCNLNCGCNRRLALPPVHSWILMENWQQRYGELEFWIRFLREEEFYCVVSELRTEEDGHQHRDEVEAVRRYCNRPSIWLFSPLPKVE